MGEEEGKMVLVEKWRHPTVVDLAFCSSSDSPLSSPPPTTGPSAHSDPVTAVDFKPDGFVITRASVGSGMLTLAIISDSHGIRESHLCLILQKIVILNGIEENEEEDSEADVMSEGLYGMANRVVNEDGSDLVLSKYSCD